jgi:hypothetical protein
LTTPPALASSCPGRTKHTNRRLQRTSDRGRRQRGGRLEFEAVFFVGIDHVAERMPDLFERYLYVGLTRAATYLAITCGAKLPMKLDELPQYFGPMTGWTGETA